MIDPGKRFWSKVRKTSACWLWTAGRGMGYGSFRCDGRAMWAHRVAWEVVHGPLPQKHQLLHLCGTKLCVRPNHMKLIAPGDSTLIGPSRAKGSVYQNGYRYISHGRSVPQTLEHRDVMARTLGRPLSTDEHVHHKNGDRLDNRPENLEVLSNADHQRAHHPQGWLGHPMNSPIAVAKRWKTRRLRCLSKA